MATPAPSPVSSEEAQPPAQLPLRQFLKQDKTLRTLLAVTTIDTIGRGSFFTLTALYITVILGIDAVQMGIGLTIAGAVGVVASLVGGHLADRFSSRRLMIGFHVMQGLALCSYVLAKDFLTLVIVASLVACAQQAGSSVRSAVIGRAFTGEDRVRVRAIMRTMTNGGIAVGTTIAAIPLAIGTPEAYRITMGLSGLLFLCGAVLLRRLEPARVDKQGLGRRDKKTMPDAAATAALAESVTTGAIPVVAVREAPEAPASHDKQLTPKQPVPKSPYKDVRYLAITALCGLFAMQYGLFEVAVPLWVVKHTDAPQVMVSPLLLINTLVVVLLTVKMSRGTGDLRGAARAMIWSGWLMAGACALWAWAGSLPMGIVIAVLVGAAVVHTLGEILSSAAGWSMSYELAPEESIGSYQGVFGTGYAVAAMLAPTVVTFTAVDMGAWGWGILAVLFVVCAFLAAWMARRAHDRQASELMG